MEFRKMLAAAMLSLAIAGCSQPAANQEPDFDGTFEVDTEHDSFTIKGNQVARMLRKAYPAFMEGATVSPDVEWGWIYEFENGRFLAIYAYTDADGYVTNFSVQSDSNPDFDRYVDNNAEEAMQIIVDQCKSVERPKQFVQDAIESIPVGVTADGCYLSFPSLNVTTYATFAPESYAEEKE